MKWHEVIFRASPYINSKTIHEHIGYVLNSLPTFQKLPEVLVQKIKSLEEAMEDLSERIKKALRMNFNEIAGQIKTKEDKINVIVTFLAMLELVKQGMIDVTQNNLFDPIDIETEKADLPRYVE